MRSNRFHLPSPLLRHLRALFAVRSLFIALLLISAGDAFAGGPKYIAGASYFNPGTMGTPLTWPGATLNYYTDHGNLSPIYPGPSADALVADAFSQWTSVSTAAISALRAGQLGEDVSGSNVFRNPDGTITMPSDILPTATGTPVAVVYDSDGTVTNALLGQGAGDPSECFDNAAYGWIDNFATNAFFAHALVVINGNCAQSTSQQTDVEYRLVRVLGRILGLDWSQVNDNVFTHNPPPTPDDYAGLPVMHAYDPPNCIPITLCYSNPYQPKMDDRAAISRLYPGTAHNDSARKQTFADSTARIYGSVYFTTATGEAAQPMQGVNVVARWIDPSTGQPSRAYAAASVSGFLFCGNAGTTVTGFNDSSGLPWNRYGSNDPSVEGFFDLVALEIPNGASTAQYQLTVEAIDDLWSTTVGPYEPWQVQPSGSIQPIVVNVSLGGSAQQDIFMSGSAVQKPDPFPLTTYAQPASVPDGGDWSATLSGYGDMDYFWFSGQANRTLSIMTTALDESSAPTLNKAQPVIGMWTLSDPGTYPAPAYTPSAFNTAYLGMTMLNAQLLQQTDFRIGIADVRGDGRPDYAYHARIFYGDNAAPNRASVAGNTPLTIQGIGFHSDTAVSIGKTSVVALSTSAGQIELLAPAQADGVQNVTLLDPATGASSVMTGVLTYGAGPNDTLKLIYGANPWTPVGGQAPNPIRVQVLQPDGITPVSGASVFFSASLPVGFSACSNASTCNVISDATGQAWTYVTPLAAGGITITAQLAPASYSPAKQVQTTLAANSSSLDLALAPQTVHIAEGATANVTLTARVLSNGTPVKGAAVTFAVVRGSGTLSSPVVLSDQNGYASTTLTLTAFASDVQVNASVSGETNPQPEFYGTAVPVSGLQLQPIAGINQMIVAGQSFQPITVEVSDFSTPPNSVMGASVAFQSTGERLDTDPPCYWIGDTRICPDPEPVILWSSNTSTGSDINGIATLQLSTNGFTGALQIVGSSNTANSNVPFLLQLFP